VKLIQIDESGSPRGEVVSIILQSRTFQVISVDEGVGDLLPEIDYYRPPLQVDSS